MSQIACYGWTIKLFQLTARQPWTFNMVILLESQCHHPLIVEQLTPESLPCYITMILDPVTMNACKMIYLITWTRFRCRLSRAALILCFTMMTSPALSSWRKSLRHWQSGTERPQIPRRLSERLGTLQHSSRRRERWISEEEHHRCSGIWGKDLRPLRWQLKSLQKSSELWLGSLIMIELTDATFHVLSAWRQNILNPGREELLKHGAMKWIGCRHRLFIWLIPQLRTWNMASRATF